MNEPHTPSSGLRVLHAIPEGVTCANPAFRRDGGAVAYCALGGARWSLVLEGEKSLCAPDVDPRPELAPFFDPAGRPVYVIRQGEGSQVVVGLSAGPVFDRVELPRFSLDGETFAYRALRGGLTYVVVNHEPGAAHAAAGAPLLSDDGKVVAYWAKDGPRAFMVVNGSRQGEFDEILSCGLSSDGRHVAHAGRRDGVASVILDGACVASIPSRVAGLTLSADGKRLAYVAADERGAVLVLDGQEVARELVLTDPVFSPDGLRLACRAKAVGGAFVVVDGLPGQSFGDVSRPVFAPDSRSLAYRAAEAKRARGGESYRGEVSAGRPLMVRDGTAGPAFSQVGDPIFSPDGKRLAYWVKDGKSERVVLEGRKSEGFDLVASIEFAADVPDGALSIGALRGRELVWARFDADSAAPARARRRSAPTAEPVSPEVLERLDASRWAELPETEQDRAVAAVAAALGAEYAALPARRFSSGGASFRIGRLAHRPSAIEFCLVPGGQARLGLSAREAERVEARLDEKRGEVDWSATPPRDVRVAPFLCARLPANLVQVAADDARLEELDELNEDGATLARARKWAARFGWRLPTDDELEYAIRGSTRSLFFWGDEVVEDVRSTLHGPTATEEDLDRACNAFGLAGVVSVAHWTQDGFLRGGAGAWSPWQTCDEWLLCVSGYRRRPDRKDPEARVSFRPVLSIPAAPKTRSGAPR
jgi:hypothetical protein